MPTAGLVKPSPNGFSEALGRSVSVSHGYSGEDQTAHVVRDLLVKNSDLRRGFL